MHRVHKLPEVALGITGGYGFHEHTSKLVTIVYIIYTIYPFSSEAYRSYAGASLSLIKDFAHIKPFVVPALAGSFRLVFRFG